MSCVITSPRAALTLLPAFRSTSKLSFPPKKKSYIRAGDGLEMSKLGGWSLAWVTSTPYGEGHGQQRSFHAPPPERSHRTVAETRPASNGRVRDEDPWRFLKDSENSRLAFGPFEPLDAPGGRTCRKPWTISSSEPARPACSSGTFCKGLAEIT